MVVLFSCSKALNLGIYQVSFQFFMTRIMYPFSVLGSRQRPPFYEEEKTFRKDSRVLFLRGKKSFILVGKEFFYEEFRSQGV